MELDLPTILALLHADPLPRAIGLSPLYWRLTDEVKPFVEDSRFYPWIACAWAVAINVALAIFFQNDLRLSLAYALMMGLATAGAYRFWAMVQSRRKSSTVGESPSTQ